MNCSPLEEYPSSAVHRNDFPSLSPRLSNRVNKGLSSHRRQPTRLPRPWDSPGKNTGVGCHFLLQCMKVKSESEVAQSCLTLHGPMDCSLPGSSAHGIFQARVQLLSYKLKARTDFKSTVDSCHLSLQRSERKRLCHYEKANIPQSENT